MIQFQAQFTMETPMKRARTEDEMQSFLDQLPLPDYKEEDTCKIEKTMLMKLEQDVNSIKTNLEKKKSIVTLSQVNEKVDLILTILQSWNV